MGAGTEGPCSIPAYPAYSVGHASLCPACSRLSRYQQEQIFPGAPSDPARPCTDAGRVHLREGALLRAGGGGDRRIRGRLEKRPAGAAQGAHGLRQDPLHGAHGLAPAATPAHGLLPRRPHCFRPGGAFPGQGRRDGLGGRPPGPGGAQRQHLLPGRGGGGAQRYHGGDPPPGRRPAGAPHGKDR